ncbi:MAG: hypothetical protein JO015_00310 [Verrucomicrobia bacterium]|nr:hypothetical protein [Verrucomicrobiota bacterium]
MKFASVIFMAFAVSSIPLAPQARAASSTFDGPWAVTLYTPEYKDPTGVVARAYTFQFPAQVKDGVLHGEHGTRGQPAWLALDGKIQQNGSATLHARGITGREEYNLGHVKTGRPYEYDVNAHFAGREGSGRRVGGRIGNFTFVKS